MIFCIMLVYYTTIYLVQKIYYRKSSGDLECFLPLNLLALDKKNRNTECLTRNIKGLLKMKFSDLNTLLKKLLTTFEVICYLYIVLLLLKVFQFYPNRLSIDLDILSAPPYLQTSDIVD